MADPARTQAKADLTHKLRQAISDVLDEAQNSDPQLTSDEIMQCHLTAGAEIIGAAASMPTSAINGAEKQKKKKPVRVYVDGCFDIMHSGHYNAIRQARALGDVLIAGVHSNAEIQRNKGPPVMSDDERLAAVKSCKWVDEVVWDVPYSPSVETLDRVNADFSVHGDDMPVGEDGTNAYQGVQDAGRLRIIKRTEGISTTDIVGRLLLVTKDHHIKSNSKLGDSSRRASDVDVDTTVSTAHYARDAGSKFLPTTWRISQFSNKVTPKTSDKIVYIDGSFDLFHIGHMATLEKAKQMGDFLYVGIHDDATVNARHGANFPIMNIHERVLNVLSCKHVDEVVIGAPWTITEDLIRTLNIDIVASGSNTKVPDNAVQIEDGHAVPKSLGIYQEVETTCVLTTDMVIDRIVQNRLKYVKRNESREKKELDYIKDKTYVKEV